MFRLLVVLSFLVVVPLVKADPVTFDFGSVVALQNGGNSSVNLNTPNLLLAPTSIDSSGVRSLNLSFDLVVDAGQTWTGVVRYDWVLNGIHQRRSIPIARFLARRSLFTEPAVSWITQRHSSFQHQHQSQFQLSIART
jgi:hypothetical protein